MMGGKSPRMKRIFAPKPKAASRHTENQQMLSSSGEEQPTSPPVPNRRSESVSAATLRGLKQGSQSSASKHQQRRGTFTTYCSVDITSPYTEPGDFGPLKLQGTDPKELLQSLKKVCATIVHQIMHTFVHYT